MNFVSPWNRKDSVVSERINYDLLTKARLIQEGTLPSPELLGRSNKTKTSDNIPTAIQKHLTHCWKQTNCVFIWLKCIPMCIRPTAYRRPTAPINWYVRSIWWDLFGNRMNKVRHTFNNGLFIDFLSRKIEMKEETTTEMIAAIVITFDWKTQT